MNYDPYDISDVDTAKAKQTNMFNWEEPTVLKTKCWVCNREFKPSQVYDYSNSHYRVKFEHCGKLEEKNMKEEEIKKCNESGHYYAFMW
jgi:hypothetical protein